MDITIAFFQTVQIVDGFWFDRLSTQAADANRLRLAPVSIFVDAET